MRDHLSISQNPQKDAKEILSDLTFHSQQNPSFTPEDVELFNRMLDRLIEVNPNLNIEAENLKK